MAAAIGAVVAARIESLESRLLFSVPAMGVNIRRLGPDSGDELFADAMKESGAWFQGAYSFTAPAAPVDANGWPTTDAGVTVINNNSNDGGTYALSFTGQAIVTADPADPGITVVNSSYDPNANTTTASVVVPDGSNQVILDFTNTQRQPTDIPGTGITNVELMRPTSIDSSTSYSPSTLFSSPILTLLSNFSALRYMDYSLTNSNTQVNWSDRTLPSQEQYNSKGGAWEYAVALANQTGNDMWINIPEMATNAYITSLAQLIDYGSDGVNPYTGPMGSAVSSANPNPVPDSGPVWAGLNPNLHVYVEYSNEVWNTGFAQNQENLNAAVAEVNAGGSPLNFDGDTSEYDWAIRRTAERTVETSNLFRDVFGSDQMITRIRPVYQWQYSNLNNTASQGLEFINNYYNNGDGTAHVADPHPANYYLWGAGGGWYGGLSNPNGTGDVTITNANFALPAITDYQQDPATTDWSFSGSAGIAANGSDLGNPASTSGTQAAYIQGSGSFSETVNFTGGLADLAFNAATLGGESFTVSVDGNDVSSNWTLGSSYSVQRTAVFDTGVSNGPHTITFTGNGGAGSVFISNVVAETVNGMYESAIQDISSTTQSESSWAAAFGLHMASYEGGFVFGTGSVGTPLQIDANQDIRAEAADIAQMDEFYASGGDLAMYYDTTNHIWALTLDINDQNTPKIDAVQSVLAAPQPAVNFGAVLPTTTGNSVIVANTLGKYQGAVGLYPICVSTPGTYTVMLTGKQTGTEQEHFLIDGQSIGTTMLPTGSSGVSSPGLQFTVTTPGLHAILVTTTGTGSLGQSNPAGAIQITAGTVSDNTATKLAFTTPPPASVVAGAAIGSSGINVAVENSSGVVQTGNTSTITLTLHGGTFANGKSTATATAVNGVATFTGLMIDKAASYTFTATDSNTTLSSATSASFKIIAGPASASYSFVTVSSGTLPLGATAVVTLRARDIHENNLTTGGLKIAFKLAGSGTASGTFSAVTDHGNGTYTAIFTATTPGTARQIAATIGGVAVTAAEPTITVPFTPITPKSVVFRAIVGHSTYGAVATFSVPDLSAVASDFTATIIWGDTPTSYAGTILKLSSGNFQVTGTHIYGALSPKTGYAIKVTIREAGGLTSTITSTGIVTTAA